MLKVMRGVVCTGLWVLALASVGRGAEPWADTSLPVRDGLALWLDAGTLPAAVAAHDANRPAPTDNQAVETWFDGSGHQRDIHAATESARPAFSTNDNGATLRFDGKDDVLTLSDVGLTSDGLTAFVVAGPRSNPGGFRSFLCASAAGKNDYQTGFNIDQGAFETTQFEVVNVEGAGFGGMQDLWVGVPQPFGTFHLIEVSANQQEVTVVVDGQVPGKSRRRESKSLSFDELSVGARLLARDRPVQGYLDGDVAEILLYDRALDDEELKAVRTYLLTKYEKTIEISTIDQMLAKQQIQTVADPPAVQMFVPGFTVRQLPIELSNVNNLLYREDGKLVALAYDGTVYLLTDSDGDGLEDTADVFWDSAGQIRSPIGMDLTPPGYPRGRGLFVTSKGKCSLIVDADGDDRGDEEIIVADGWKELGHGVDGLGVAFDKRDGSVWFGLGTQNFTNGYLLDETGHASYRLDSERGAILRVEPDFQHREIACTGIRFPVAMRFNARGDLFCTDQEGATWLPNGNPFDELLHIETGRHYGFPPAHPRHLPNVVDEPSTFDYGPQHQSTCGLNFDEPVREGGPIFGPDNWRGDALVTGYSRGKLYRTKLVPTPAGYVAQNQLLGCANMLPADACVSPAGDLVVAMHSGSPDWGSGPGGAGKLYKIAYSDRERPVPVAVWAAGPRQVQVAFDRPLTPDDLAGVTDGVHIEHGAWLRAGDRFESLRPGYAVVQRQMVTPRFDLPVYGVQVTPDRRNLVIETVPQSVADHYGLTLSVLGRPPRPETTSDETPEVGDVLPQYPETDLHYTLGGVSAELSRHDQPVWSGWLPHLDVGVANRMTVGSAFHDEFRATSRRADRLTFSTQLDLHHMLRPEIQPGSTIDYEYRPEAVTLVLRSPCELRVTAPSTHMESDATNDGGSVVRVSVEEASQAWLPIEIDVQRRRPDEELTLAATWFTADDPRERPFPLRRFFLPWAQPDAADAAAELESSIATLPPELEGGNWRRGRDIFFGVQAACSKCHRLGSAGGRIGPDLSNLRHRDYHSVLRDVVTPSFAINPDHLTYTVLLKGGTVLTGLVRKDEGQLIVGTAKAEEIRIDPADVDEMVPATVSIMPEGIDKLLGPDKMRDLLTFLIGPSPHMPEDRAGAPAPRSLAEVERVLAGSAKPSEPPRSLQLVLVAGAKDHGPGEHDYPAWLRAWTVLFESADNVSVTTAMDWPDQQAIESADAIVFYQKGKWTPERAADIDRFLARGGGVSYIHYAVDGGTDAAGFAERIGLAWKGGGSRFRHGPVELLCEQHAITRNLRRIQLEDESYWQLVGDPGRIDLLADGVEEDTMQPLLWCREQGAGRVFVSIPGHYSWTFDDPLFRVLLLRGIAWTAHESVDRFNDLVLLGASVDESADEHGTVP